MKKLLIQSIPFITALLLYTGNIYGQGWEKTFGDTLDDIGYCVNPTSDGGYILTGGLNKWFNQHKDIYILKTDANGKISWSRIIEGTDKNTGHYIEETDDGGYILTGYSGDMGVVVFLMKLDVLGSTEWTKTFGNQLYSNWGNTQQTTDGGYIVVANSLITSGGNSDILLTKTDANGETVWTKLYGDSSYDQSYFVRQTSDGGYILTGYSTDTSGASSIYVIKTDMNGDTIWTKKYDESYGVSSYAIRQTSDNGYIIAGSYPANLIKTDSIGNILWSVRLSNGNGFMYSVQQTHDGGYILTLDNSLIKTDPEGNTEWIKNFNGKLYYVRQVKDKGYIITGRTSFGGSADVYLIKTDSTGKSVNNFISGRIFWDKNNNCLYDSADLPLKNWLMKMESTSKENYKKYASSGMNGEYGLIVDSGSYSGSLITDHPFMDQTCPSDNSYDLNFTTQDTLVNNVDFTLEATYLCPMLSVDISSGFSRPCRSKNYSVSYCNNGTADANNVSIDITFDALLTIDSSTLAWSSVNENTYTFDLGSVAIAECNTFRIYSFVSCDAIIDESVCTEAFIYPDTICTPADPEWDKSSVYVEGTCFSDSVCFTITNTGNAGDGNMEGPSQWRLYANDTLVASDDFQIDGGEATELCFEANGKTLRLEADQRPGHPGNSKPRAIVEGCGTDENGDVDYGYVVNAPQDDADHFKEIDCDFIRNSYDPNDKTTYPRGITDNRFIDSVQQVEYRIRFQNTGNDTAFKVVIRDTLNTEYLDIGSIQSGVSSHDYTFRIYGQGILEWTFNNILLVDSNTNEPESHGYVKFKVDQQPGNEKGTIIENKAGIYFDYNVPVITNTAFNTVGDVEIEKINRIKPILTKEGGAITVSPNPFSGLTELIIENMNLTNGNYMLEVYNVTGQKVKDQKIISNKTPITSEKLSQGLHFYLLKNNNAIIYSGKLIVIN